MVVVVMVVVVMVKTGSVERSVSQDDTNQDSSHDYDALVAVDCLFSLSLYHHAGVWVTQSTVSRSLQTIMSTISDKSRETLRDKSCQWETIVHVCPVIPPDYVQLLKRRA